MPNYVKNTTILSPFDLIAPHSCRGCGSMGNILCNRCKKHILSVHKNLCPICKAPNTNGICHNHPQFPPCFIINERTDLIDVLLHEFKYSSIRSLAKPLAELLDETIPLFTGQTTIIPLPTISKHIHQRGFDHTYLIAKKLAKIRKSNYRVAKLIIRQNNTVQVGATRNTRISQAKKAYSLSKNVKINPDTTYILFDDVWTTGASMQSAVSLLQKAGAQKIAIALIALSRIN